MEHTIFLNEVEKLDHTRAASAVARKKTEAPLSFSTTILLTSKGNAYALHRDSRAQGTPSMFHKEFECRVAEATVGTSID